MNTRIYKINELLKEEISKLLLTELEEHKGFVTISAVETTADLRQSTVWYLVLGGDEDSISKMIEDHRKDIQKTVNSRLSLRHVPRIEFKVDRSGEYANEISQLITETNNGKN